jgi:ABC-2 type transport system permease protein
MTAAAAAAAALPTLAAAARKEWQIIRRYTGLWVQLLFWPLALPLVYVLQAHAYSGGDPKALAAFADRAGTSDLAGFLFVGWSVYMWLSIVLWGPGTQLRQQQVQGQLEAVFLTPASRPAILFGPMAAYLVLSLWQFLIVGLALRFGFGVGLGAAEAARALAVVAVSVPALYGLGAVFCGMTYPIVIVPGWAQQVARSLPPTYVIADFRQVLLRGAGLVQLLPDFAVLLGSGAVLCLAAAIAFNATERHARRGGALVQY